MDDVMSFPVREPADQWSKEDRGLMGTGSHVIWDGKPLTSLKKGSWAQGEGKPRRKRSKVQSPSWGRGGGPWKQHELKINDILLICFTRTFPLSSVPFKIQLLVAIGVGFERFLLEEFLFDEFLFDNMSSYLIIWVFLLIIRVFLFDNMSQAESDEVTRETSPASDESLQERDHVTRGNPWVIYYTLLTKPQHKWYKLAEGFLLEEFLFNNMSSYLIIGVFRFENTSVPFWWVPFW